MRPKLMEIIPSIDYHHDAIHAAIASISNARHQCVSRRIVCLDAPSRVLESSDEDARQFLDWVELIGPDADTGERENGKHDDFAAALMMFSGFWLIPSPPKED